MTLTTRPQWEQQGIEGLVPNKPLAQEDKTVVRKRLLDYIENVFNTTRLGFAKLLHVSPATISKWLYTTTMPSAHVLVSISRHTGLDYEEVLDLFSEGT